MVEVQRKDTAKGYKRVKGTGMMADLADLRDEQYGREEETKEKIMEESTGRYVKNDLVAQNEEVSHEMAI